MTLTKARNTEAGKPGYQYSALDPEHPHIRLVTLNPGSWSDAISCTIRVVRFDEQPAYEALSYVWGDPNVWRTIRLNDHDFRVTENLWLAMRRLRNPSTPRVIWIDAICINQKQDDEKSQQLLDLPWWRRIWVIQELVLPSSVTFLYASEEIPYQTLRGVVDMLKTHAATCCKPQRMTLQALAFDPLLVIQEQVDPMVSTRETWAKQEPTTLFQLRRQFYAFQATEKRDLFYGLLGLVTNWYSTKPLQPKYGISLRAAVTEAVFKCISEQGGMEFLLGERLFRASDQRDTPDLPSWVPDAYFCSIPSQWVMVEQRRLRISSSFAASGSCRPLRSTRLPEWDLCAMPWKNWTKAPDVFRQWMEMLELGVRDWPEQPPPAGSLMDVFWRTMLNNSVEADTESLSYRKPTAGDYSQLRSLWFFVLGLSPPVLEIVRVSLNLESHDTLLSKAPQTVYHIVVCLWHRRLFVTERGMIGLAPRDASVDDEVHIILGSPAPFILRRLEEPAKAGNNIDPPPPYTVIGNGYLHDIMSGEALENRREGAVKTIAIH